MPNAAASDKTSASVTQLTLTIVATTLCRLVLNTARRFVYPFAPALSRGLRVPLTAITSLIAVNQATVALFLAGLGKSIFDPALQAYVGERVPFHRRGLVIGFLEFSWAGSTLLGIPAIALLIDRQHRAGCGCLNRRPCLAGRRYIRNVTCFGSHQRFGPDVDILGIAWVE